MTAAVVLSLAAMICVTFFILDACVVELEVRNKRAQNEADHDRVQAFIKRWFSGRFWAFRARVWHALSHATGYCRPDCGSRKAGG